VSGNNNGNNTHRRYGHVGFVYIGYHGAGSAPGARSPAMASVSKGGFGSVGGRVGGG
jgi:hypothetical protein